jgi:quinol monooxygenase YgiN
MFVATFKMQGKPSCRTETSQSLSGIADKVRVLEDCMDAAVYQDINNENIFFLVEEWQHQRKWDDHTKSSLFAALLGINGLLVKPMEIKFMVEN